MLPFDHGKGIEHTASPHRGVTSLVLGTKHCRKTKASLPECTSCRPFREQGHIQKHPATRRREQLSQRKRTAIERLLLSSEDLQNKQPARHGLNPKPIESNGKPPMGWQQGWPRDSPAASQHSPALPRAFCEHSSQPRSNYCKIKTSIFKSIMIPYPAPGNMERWVRTHTVVPPGLMWHTIPKPQLSFLPEASSGAEPLHA